MSWSKKLTQLNDVLAYLAPSQQSVQRYATHAGIKIQKITFSGNAEDMWNSTLDEANKMNLVDELVKQVLKDYEGNPYLIAALNEEEIDYSLSPEIDKNSGWKPVSKQTLEVLTFAASSLLPINFLEQGVIKSRSVAKVEIQRGARTDVGTGFLFRIDGIDRLFFMTNYHVLNNRDHCSSARVIFDFEMDIYGETKKSKSFQIDSTGPWLTSPVHDKDVAVFCLIDDTALSVYGFLKLEPVEVDKNDFVNIIQHPGGGMKQISLYHNIVTHSDTRVIQYLTDTLKGSSGSPVFNSRWQVAALHHSGGNRKPGESDLPDGIKSRNEGIHINGIIEFVRAEYMKITNES
ncbi:MAG: trypsin-like peptidase domain-containing protein [Pedobacter sp.]|uniref:trypsin-like peptidase domain-containing protein n=1 Tax=Pedobacter sp. TaxID=1411316 RepID=UPI003569F9AC